MSLEAARPVCRSRLLSQDP